LEKVSYFTLFLYNDIEVRICCEEKSNEHYGAGIKILRKQSGPDRTVEFNLENLRIPE